MTTYTKSIQPGRNIFQAQDGSDYRTITMQDYGGYLHCDVSDSPFSGETESSSQEEFEDVGDEVLEFSRLGQRPTHAP